jgi:D-amino-acid dehydrogenase
VKVVVLGAGVIGTAAAWYLRAAGHDVQVLERRAAAGMETSFANGGQISASHALPWAAPGVPWKALKWMLREDAPLLFRLRADPAQWRWGLRFLRECSAGRFRANAAQLQRLGRYSRDALHELQRATGIEYDQVRKGILAFFTGEIPRKTSEKQWKTPDECIAIEPALAHARDQLLGGEYLDDDESGDAHKFTRELAKHCVARGVRFDFDVDIEGFSTSGEKITGVETRKHGIVSGDAYVLSLGSYSPLLVRPLGINLAIYPLKGYSITMPVKDPKAAWTTSLTDEAHKLVFSRLGERLRVAGTAEMNGYNTGINEVRCRAIVERVHELFPGAGDETRVEYWAGLRPATPSNIPYIGRTRYPNLFLDTGHGTLGWTHACGSGKALAEIVSGRPPGLDFSFS